MLKSNTEKNTQLIAVGADNPQQYAAALTLAQRLHLPYCQLPNNDCSYILALTETHLELRKSGSKENPLLVDFLSAAATHRRLQGGGTGQLIAKAVGIKKQYRPQVLDLSAGLGRDAFVLASLGCKVLMLERSPILAAMLEDGLTRLAQQETLDIQLCHVDSHNYLQQLTTESWPEVIYFDPMFPERHKTALVKKEMRILKDVVGEDTDAAELLSLALKRAKKRVVVKRPKIAGSLISDPLPDIIYKGKSGRFDVYFPKFQLQEK